MPWAAPSQSARASRYTPAVGDGAALGTGLAAAFFAAFGGAFLAGAGPFAAFLAGDLRAAPAVRPARGFAVPAVPWEPLPDVREAMMVRLPVRTPADTCAHRFTRSCRLRVRRN